MMLCFGLIFLLSTTRAVEQICTEGDVRYDPNSDPAYKFVIQICSANKWGYICARNKFSERLRVANVICQQMGFSSQAETGNIAWNYNRSNIHSFK